MEYLSSFPIENTKSKEESIMDFIEYYGQVEGEHHKAWVIDQISRIVNDTPVIYKEARFTEDYSEIRFETADPPSDKYLTWVEVMRGKYDEENEEYEYYYEEGVAP